MRAVGVWVAVLVVAVLLGAGGPVWQQRQASARYPVQAQVLDEGRAALAALRVAPADGQDSYERTRFGQAWADEDHNGCDTRNDVLARDLVEASLDPATGGCVVLTGLLDDPYTGAVITFRRGAASADVQIDHVVALADAWSSGARDWTLPQRQAFANDPANLLAVDGSANQDKGASNAAAWLPPNTGYRCVYALRQLRVKSAYGLSVTPDEQRALARALDTCATA